MKNPIYASTGAFLGKSNGYNYRLMEPLSKTLTCDGFELMVDDEWYPEIEEVKQYIKNLNLYIPVVHCAKDIGELISKGGEEELAAAYQMFETDCGVAKYLGAEKLVLHLWGGRTSDSNFQSNIRAYQHLNGVVKSHGLTLMVENIVCNVENPMKHLCELREIYPDIKYVFDTKMAAFHEQMDLLYETEYDWLWKENHILHYHVNDYAGGYKDWPNLRTLPVGKGRLDLKRFLQFVKKTGYEGFFTAEGNAQLGDGMVDVETLNQQFREIRNA
jgi:sugar phosphate isomerase/epimerase